MRDYYRNDALAHLAGHRVQVSTFYSRFMGTFEHCPKSGLYSITVDAEIGVYGVIDFTDRDIKAIEPTGKSLEYMFNCTFRIVLKAG